MANNNGMQASRKKVPEINKMEQADSAKVTNKKLSSPPHPKGSGNFEIISLKLASFG